MSESSFELKSSTESREEKFEKAMQIRHKIAVAGYNLEKMVFEDEADSEKIKDFLRRSDIPETVRVKLEAVYEQFFITNKRLDEAQAQLEKIIGFSLTDGPEHFGSAVFLSRTGDQPKGVVRLSRKSGFFLLEFVEVADFAKYGEHETEFDSFGKLISSTRGSFSSQDFLVLTREGADPDSRKKNEDRRQMKKNLEYQIRQACRLEDYEEEIRLRQKQEEMEIIENPFEEIFSFRGLPIMELNGQANDRLLRNTINHERQHAVFSFFKDEKDPFDRVKNELLARLRGGGNHGVDALDFLNFENSYWNLATKLTEEQVSEAKRKLKEMTNKLNFLAEKFFPGSLCSILVFHLMDIPFTKIPQRLESIQFFYGKFLEPLSEFAPPDETDFSDEYVVDLSDILYGFVKYEGRPQVLADEVLCFFKDWQKVHTEVCRQLILGTGRRFG